MKTLAALLVLAAPSVSANHALCSDHDFLVETENVHDPVIAATKSQKNSKSSAPAPTLPPAPPPKQPKQERAPRPAPPAHLFM